MDVSTCLQHLRITDESQNHCCVHLLHVAPRLFHHQNCKNNCVPNPGHAGLPRLVALVVNLVPVLDCWWWVPAESKLVGQATKWWTPMTSPSLIHQDSAAQRSDPVCERGPSVVKGLKTRWHMVPDNKIINEFGSLNPDPKTKDFSE